MQCYLLSLQKKYQDNGTSTGSFNKHFQKHHPTELAGFKEEKVTQHKIPANIEHRLLSKRCSPWEGQHKI